MIFLKKALNNLYIFWKYLVTRVMLQQIFIFIGLYGGNFPENRH